MNLFNSDERLEQSEKGIEINDKMPLYAFEYLKSQYKDSLKNKKVLLLGVSYLNDVGDTRYTPVEGFYDRLESEDCEITLHDPHVLYWEEKNLSPASDINEVFKLQYDIIVITTGHKEYRNNPSLIKKIMQQPSGFIYDTIGVLSRDEIKTLTSRHIVKVIGRGDL